MKEKEIILGLDISTKTIGVTLFLNDGTKYGKILKMSHISPNVPKKIDKVESLFLKKRIFHEDFLKHYTEYGIKRVIIEAPLLRSQNINTVAKLLQFNGMISDCVYNELGIVPEYISSYDARQYSFPELMSLRIYNKKGEKYDIKHYQKYIKDNKLVLFGAYPWDIDKKNILLSNISEIYPNITFIFDDYGNLKEENFDANDSLIAILGKLSMDKHKDDKFEIVSSDIKENEITYQVKFGEMTYSKKIEM
jgi:hypothetical protein